MNYRKLAFEKYWFKKKCNRCWIVKWKICVHHKDWNRSNNDKSNFEILCHSCHMSEHHKNNKYNLWNKHSNEVKRKIGEVSKWNKHALWYKHTEEAKKKISESSKGNKRALWWTWNIWRKHSKETKEKIRKSMLLKKSN